MRRKTERIISFVTSIALLMPGTQTTVLAEEINNIQSRLGIMNAIVSLAAIADENDNTSDENIEFADVPMSVQASDPVKEIIINDISDLVSLSQMDAQSYQYAKITFANRNVDNRAQNFQGLGSDSYPFAGEICSSGTNTINLMLDTNLFKCIYDSAVISADINIARVGDNSLKTSLFANKVKHDTKNSEIRTWKITASKGIDSLTNHESSFPYSGILGNVEDNTKINLEINENSGSKIEGATYAGLICCQIGKNVVINADLKNSTSSYDVSSRTGSGSLAGYIGEKSELNVSGGFAYKGTVSAENVGGLVGHLKNGIINIDGQISINSELIGTKDAGGMIGKSELSSDLSLNITGTKIDVRLKGNNCGGVIGEVITSSSLEIFSGSDAPENVISVNKGCTEFGGIIGKYSSSVLKSTLNIHHVQTQTSNNSQKSEYGGLISMVDGTNGTYVKISDVDVRSEGFSNNRNYGGIIGNATDTGHFIDLSGKIKVSGDFSSTSGYAAGGLIGNIATGVVRISGETDMSLAAPSSAEKNGQLIGNCSGSLIYALGNGSDDGWTFMRCNEVKTDDIGNWGEVIRKIDNMNIEDSGVVSWDDSSHTLTVSSGVSEISSVSDFAKTAVNMQINYGNKGALLFTGSNMLESDISFVSDIDLSGTGLNGFLRDDGNRSFSGKVNGNNNKVTVSIGESYGKRGDQILINDDSEGNGKIYRHKYNGLFSVVKGDITVENIVIDGMIKVDPELSATIYTGGLIGLHSNGKLYLNNLNVKTRLIIGNSKNSTSGKDPSNENFYVGGTIGVVESSTEIIIDSCNFDSDINCYKNNVRCGGVFGKIKDSSKCSFYKVKSQNKVSSYIGKVGGITCYMSNSSLYFDEVCVQNSVIITQKTDKNDSGGVIGCEWTNSKVFFKTKNESGYGLKVTGDSNITAENQNLGGLVYKATGYWQVNDLIIDSMKIDLSKNTTSVRYGMMVNNYAALYIELTSIESYKINNNGFSIIKGTSFSNYDEFAYTGKNSGVISIPAVDSNGNRALIMDGQNRNTYTEQYTETGKSNSNSRYYYNLDVIRNNVSNDSEKLLIWSVWTSSDSLIKEYFSDHKIKNNTITGNFDMKGYSYYPINFPVGEVTIKDATFTFYNKEFDLAETKYTYSSTNKRDSDSNQHQFMHYGLFESMTTSKAQNKTLNITGNVLFTGTYGYKSDRSGVLFCNEVKGTADAISPGYSTIFCDDSCEIIIQDAYKYDKTGKQYDYNKNNTNCIPMLIRNIKSYSKVFISGVRCEYTDMSKYAASSLIGEVGGTDAANGVEITLAFSRIKIDSLSSAHIFKRASLLDSFRYIDSMSSGAYNFTWEDAWNTDGKGNGSENVTYGLEITETRENRDGDISLQTKYYKDFNQRYSDPYNNNNTDAPYDRFTDYQPYIYNSPANNSKESPYHELQINISYANLDEGCGTYDDPYIIREADQLELIEKIISSGVIPTGSKVNYNPDKYQNKRDIGLCELSDHPAADSRVNMCDYLRTAYYIINNDITLSEKFSGLGSNDNGVGRIFMGVITGRSENGNKPVIKIEGSNPFIKISSGTVIKDVDIEVLNPVILSQKYPKLSEVGKYAFRPGLKNGGSTSDTLSSLEGGSYYGALIGQIIGGDNIIDNVSVKFDSTVSVISDSNASGYSEYNYLIPIGGYIGTVRSGGLIFKNMKGEKGLSSDVCSDIDNESRLYVNPFIGRVLDGYAVYLGKYDPDKCTLDNGNKNYCISDISDPFDSGEKISKITMAADDNWTFKLIDNKGWSGVNIPDSQSLFIFSLLVNTGASAMQFGSPSNFSDWKESIMNYAVGTAYDIGRTHLAEYSDVGKKVITDDFKLALEDCDNRNKTDTVPFLVKYYTEKVYDSFEMSSSKNAAKVSWPARLITGSNSRYKVKLEMEDCDIKMPSGFKGINSLYGSSYSDNLDRTYIAMYGFYGNNNTITINNDVRIYDNDNYTLMYNDHKIKQNDLYVSGVGFFNKIICNANSTVDTGIKDKSALDYSMTDALREKFAFCDLTLKGSVSLSVIDKDGKKSLLENSRVGGLIGTTEHGDGNDKRHLYFDNIRLEDLTVTGGNYTGGLIGEVGEIRTYNFFVRNMTADGLTVNGGNYVGGIVGMMDEWKDSNTENTNTVLIDGKSYDGKYSESEIKISSITSSGQYCGGCIGYSKKPVIIKNMIISKSDSVSKAGVQAGKYIGGLIGCTEGDSLDISDTKVGSVNFMHPDNSEKSYIGGLVGYTKNSVKIESCNSSDCGFSAGTSENNNSDNDIGGVIGFCDSDVTVNNQIIYKNYYQCFGGSSKIFNFGNIIGEGNGKIYGYNIVSNENVFDPKDSNVTLCIGDWIGKGINNKIYLCAVSRQGSGIIGKETGNIDDASCSIIYADYTGKTDNRVPFVDQESKSPYISINPVNTIGGLKITGDGFAVDASGNFISHTIFKESVTGDSSNTKKYATSNIKEYAAMFYDGLYKENHTTYQNVETDTDASKKIDGINIPVLLIDRNDTEGIMELVNNYISVLTNEDQAGVGKQLYSSIDTATYRWNDSSGKFEKLSENESSLVYRNRSLYLNIGKYDNEKKQFTLLDVKFSDPSDSTKTVYHLYIPVMVKRLLEFTFESRVRSATDYNISDYNSSNNFVIENHGSYLTNVITYGYVRTIEEWEEAINSGEDLNWNFDKRIDLRTDDKNSVLPNDTKMLLVDRSRVDMDIDVNNTGFSGTYYLITGDNTFSDREKNLNTLDFSKFKSVDDTNNEFKELTLTELLINQANVRAETDNNGNLVETESKGEATVFAKYGEEIKYFRMITEDDDEKIQRYHISVTSDKANFRLKEIYYLSVKDDINTDYFVKNYVSLFSKSLIVPDGKNGFPTHKISTENDECSFVLGNFFIQSMEVETENRDEIINISDSNIVNAKYTSTIEFKDETYKDMFEKYSHNGLELYQKFDISLKEVDMNDNRKAGTIFGRTMISYDYKVSQYAKNSSERLSMYSTERKTNTITENTDYYSLIYPESLKALLNDSNTMKIQIESNIEFIYSDEQIITEQFPERKSNNSRSGILFCGRSAIAYYLEDLEHSTIYTDICDDISNQHYYRDSTVGVRFTYNAYGDTNNPLGVYSQLGKNPSDVNEEYIIKGAGVYNPYILGEVINKADKIKVTLKLYQKNDDGQYTEIQDSKISDYIRNTDITFNGQTQRFDGTNGYSYKFNLPEHPGELDEFPEITTSFDVNSGNEFESKELMYSNYKVDISVELYYPNDTPVSNSSASDYIIFTNARIYNRLINAG